MRRILRRLWYVVHQRQIARDVAEEMAAHREMQQRDLEARGLGPDEARAAAQRTFGSATLAQDQIRDAWISPALRDIAQDVRFAARLLARDRRFTVAAVMALALGLGANTTIFTFINAALFKDLPFDEPRRLVTLGTVGRNGPQPDRPGPFRHGVSYADFEDWRTATRAFTGLAADNGASMNLSDERTAPERLRGAYVSSNLFDLLRVTPLLGRGFLPEDDRADAPPVLVLGHEVWRSRYRGDPAVIGRTVRVNDVPATVVGVMPPGFRFPMTVEVWQPLALLPNLAAATRENRFLNVTGRLADSVTMEQARSDLAGIAERLGREHPDTNQDIRPTLAPPMAVVRQSAKPFLMTLMGAVGFVLLIGCTNVATLLLARALTRAREIAIRASIGATRWRLVRQLLVESLLLAAIAGAVGLILSIYGVRYFGVAFDAFEIGAPDRSATPYWVDLSMDWRVFAFVAALCLGTSILFGLVPALHVSKTNVQHILKDGTPGAAGSRHARRWTDVFMVLELALTLVLLTPAGLLVRSFVAQYRTDLILDTTNLFTGRLALPSKTYRTSAQQQAFVERLDQRLAADPALASVAIATDVPFASLGGSVRQLSIDGQSPASGQAMPAVSAIRVGRRYFETLGLRLVQGRAFADTDAAAGATQAIVNQRFATRFFPGDDPIGRRIRLGTPDTPDDTAPWLTIIGVTPTLPQFMPAELSPEPVVYVPLRAEPRPVGLVSLLVRGRSGPGATTPHVREDLRALNPDLPLFAIQTMDDVVSRTRYSTRMIGSLFALLALIALVLATVGLSALSAHGATQRTKEMGIRQALGARATQVTWLLVRQALQQLAIGLPLGLAGALAVGQLLRAFLRTGPRDPWTLVSVTLLLVVVSLTASVWPAWRAARIDPATALRRE
jgi:putative ABC transport system permease protein